MDVYGFSVTTQDNRDVSLTDYRGKVLLIVNTATGCGFTPQYNDLQKLYQEYHAQGFEILDFPCNQFGEQAPGSDGEIHEFCTLRYKITFPQFAKIEVNGENAIPLYRWLTENTIFEGFDKLHPAGMVLGQMLKKQDPNYKNSGSVKWNFTKFLISRDGQIIARFEPTASMKKVKAAVEEALK